ncbi:hypothetical protein [Caldifermentibacillus hisashii]|uniref:hypothetical protein n=1 Tax=Caldifermentibacillus hisashii TaxID=996558 RepID=UPI003100C854
MNLRIQYTDETEKQNIINANSDKILIEEQNITEGNFLIFSDVKPIEEQVKQLQQDNLILMDAVATTFEEIIKLKTQLGGTP